MARSHFALGLLALATVGLSPAVFADAPQAPVLESPWQPVVQVDPSMPAPANTPDVPEVSVPAPRPLLDFSAPKPGTPLNHPAWYQAWSLPVLVKDGFAEQVVVPDAAPAAPVSPKVAGKSTARPSSPELRYMAPAVLRSMGALVPDLVPQQEGPVPASAMTLDELMGVIKSKHPQAEVVAGFYDWRTVSQYRRVAGLHLGYDIAMPAGTVVPVGWAGRVVAVANWVGPEYGITVDTNGFRTTYGHLSPLVHEGDVVLAGQPIGTIVHDHVDVKMRNSGGDYVDFGAHQTSELAALAPSTPYSTDPRDMGVLKFLVAQETVYQAEDRLKQDRASATNLRETLRDSLSTVKELGTQLPKMKGYYEQGLIAKVDIETAQRKWDTVTSTLKRTQTLSANADVRLTRSQDELTLARHQLADVKGANQKLGIQASDVSTFVSKYVEKHPSVLKEARNSEVTAASGNDPLPATPELAKEKERLEMLERLYQDGAVALREVEEARAHYASLQSQPRK